MLLLNPTHRGPLGFTLGPAVLLRTDLGSVQCVGRSKDFRVKEIRIAVLPPSPKARLLYMNIVFSLKSRVFFTECEEGGLSFNYRIVIITE